LLQPGKPCPNGMLECDPQLVDACVAPPASVVAEVTDGGAPVPVCATACANDLACGSRCCLRADNGSSYCFAKEFCPPPAPRARADPPQSEGGCAAGGARSPSLAATLLGAIACALLLRGRRRSR